MKLTRTHLKQLILEEMKLMKENEQEQEQEQEQGQEQGDQKADVQRVLQYIAKIDNKIEYGQLLNNILKHAQQVQGAKIAVVTAYRKIIPALIKTLK